MSVPYRSLLVAFAVAALALPAAALANKSLQTPDKNYDFGSVTLTTPSPHTFTFTNAGKSPITLTEAIVGLSSRGYTDFGLGLPLACEGATLAAGSSCDTVVYFIPSMYGRESATLKVTASDGSSAKIGLSGIGT